MSRKHKYILENEMNILVWLADKFNNRRHTPTINNNIPQPETPTISVYYGQGCSEYAPFVLKNIHKMDAKVELSKESSVWYKGEVCIQIVFPVPYIINRAYEIAESEKKRDLV